MDCGIWPLYHYVVKMSKMAKIWFFVPYFGLKNVKSGGFLRVCGRKMTGGAVKMPKNPPGWVIIVDIISKYAKLTTSSKG